MDWKQWKPTLNLLSLKSLSRSLSFSTRASLSKARAAIMRPLPILRAPPRRRVSFSLFSRGLIGRRVWGAGAALPWHPPPKLRRCGLSMTSRSSSFNRSRGSEYNAANRLHFKFRYRHSTDYTIHQHDTKLYTHTFLSLSIIMFKCLLNYDFCCSMTSQKSLLQRVVNFMTCLLV